MATRIGVIEAGRLVQVGTPREIYESPRSVYVAPRLGQPAHQPAAARGGARSAGPAAHADDRRAHGASADRQGGDGDGAWQGGMDRASRRPEPSACAHRRPRRRHAGRSRRRTCASATTSASASSIRCSSTPPATASRRAALMSTLTHPRSRHAAQAAADRRRRRARHRARRRTDRARFGHRRRRSRPQHEARLRGGARPRADAFAAMSLPELLKARRDEAGDDRRRRLGAALRHACSWRSARRCRRTPTRAQAVGGVRAGDRGGEGARQERRRAEDDARRAGADAGGAAGRAPARLRSRQTARQRGGGDGAAARDARPRLVPRRTVDRPCRSRRAVVGADRRGAVRAMERDVDEQCRHRHRVAFAQGRRGRRRHGAADGRRRRAARLDRRQRARAGLARISRRSREAIERAWSEAGVAILVDLGGAETNSEMAVEALPDDRRGKVVICNAPIVEGAVIAATEASGGAPLQRRAAHGRGAFAVSAGRGSRFGE